MSGAILGLVARPLLEALLQAARFFRDEAVIILRAWLGREIAVAGVQQGEG
jgi:hypothetical protein